MFGFFLFFLASTIWLSPFASFLSIDCTESLGNWLRERSDEQNRKKSIFSLLTDKKEMHND